MRSVFRKIREQMVKKNKTRSYLLYAIGEIVLVMIGILLALQVNNWNEGRKLKKNINNTLRNIAFDLETDTTFASSVITFYETNTENSRKIMTGEITSENYKDCMACLSLVTIYQPINIQSKGYEQLTGLIDNQSSQRDSLIIDITKFYSTFKPIIDKSNDRMEQVVMKNFTAFEEYPWFIDMAQGNFTDEVISYFVDSEDYKKRVVSHAMLAVGNHLSIVKQYDLNADDLLKRINNRLEGND